MGFIDSYKRLEKLCGEIFDNDRRINEYIDEMKNTVDGSTYVREWDKDLESLKYYRMVRNKISHDPDCNEENMCKPEDALWLDNFYSRIMNQTDPLAMYRKAHISAAAPAKRRAKNISYEPSILSEPLQTNNRQTKSVWDYLGLIFIGTVLLAIILGFLSR